MSNIIAVLIVNKHFGDVVRTFTGRQSSTRNNNLNRVTFYRLRIGYNIPLVTCKIRAVIILFGISRLNGELTRKNFNYALDYFKIVIVRNDFTCFAVFNNNFRQSVRIFSHVFNRNLFFDKYFVFIENRNGRNNLVSQRFIGRFDFYILAVIRVKQCGR